MDRATEVFFGKMEHKMCLFGICSASTFTWHGVGVPVLKLCSFQLKMPKAQWLSHLQENSIFTLQFTSGSPSMSVWLWKWIWLHGWNREVFTQWWELVQQQPGSVSWNLLQSIKLGSCDIELLCYFFNTTNKKRRTCMHMLLSPCYFLSLFVITSRSVWQKW